MDKARPVLPASFTLKANGSLSFRAGTNPKTPPAISAGLPAFCPDLINADSGPMKNHLLSREKSRAVLCHNCRTLEGHLLPEAPDQARFG